MAKRTIGTATLYKWGRYGFRLPIPDEYVARTGIEFGATLYGCTYMSKLEHRIYAEDGPGRKEASVGRHNKGRRLLVAVAPSFVRAAQAVHGQDRRDVLVEYDDRDKALVVTMEAAN